MSFPEQHCPRMGLVSRWERLKVINHQLAIRWKEDYLKALHKRYKWKNTYPNLKPDDLVVVMDDLLPPSEWRLGRIEKTYCGSDGNVRVADIRTVNGIVTRPIVKLCYLPLLKDDESSESNPPPQKTRIFYRRDSDVYQCGVCKKFHPLKYCKRFLRMDTRMRMKMVLRYRYCKNCLAKSHESRACSCTDTCRICDRYHHTLLHPSIKSRITRRRAHARRSTGASKQRIPNRKRPSIAPSTSSTSEQQQRRSISPGRSSIQRIDNSTSRPSQRIISEAIRSLAEVLCEHPITGKRAD